ncbi:MAG TPA: hypothetical protein VFY78_11905, partial [Gammaproteobacteria bacterium]|nr:hypothetical protein [Gammaproteobacteria bacterium]
MSAPKSKQRILLVEESATLRYILAKSMQKQGYELMSLDTFSAAQDTLKKSVGSYHAVIIGWPNFEKHPQVKELTDLLEHADFSETPVMLLSNDASLEVLNWMGKRRYTALVPWENYQESVATLHKLLGADKSR